MRFTAAISPEPPTHVARCLEAEFTSQAKTSDEALGETLELYFEDQPFPDQVEFLASTINAPA